MELKIVPNKKLQRERLGLSEQRSDALVDKATEWLKAVMTTGDGTSDHTDFFQYCATISENLEDYTFLLSNKDTIIEDAYQEAHEEVCPRCKARKQAQETNKVRERMEGFMGRAPFTEGSTTNSPNVTEVAPGVFIVGL